VRDIATSSTFAVAFLRESGKAVSISKNAM